MSGLYKIEGGRDKIKSGLRDELAEASNSHEAVAGGKKLLSTVWLSHDPIPIELPFYFSFS